MTKEDKQKIRQFYQFPHSTIQVGDFAYHTEQVEDENLELDYFAINKCTNLLTGETTTYIMKYENYSACLIQK